MRRDHDDAVVIAVGQISGTEGDTAEADHDVTVAGSGFGTLAGVGSQGLDADVEGPQSGGIADGAVDDQPGPAVGASQFGDDVADQRGVPMPSFLEFVLKFSLPFLLPVLLIVWLLFFQS